ncbi:MAG: DNA topoisomerase 3 [Oscillospiraceae bacterium]|nr:DNA topoisomerase 3 [Oscillospiraceae bacterium]
MASHKLVIAEKPSVAQTIAKVLGATKKGDGCVTGNGYIVSWCVGHLVGLATPEAYDEKFKTWSFDTLPIMPQSFKFVVKQATKKQFDVLKKLMSDDTVDEIICATDAGREGECIFRYVYNVAKCKKPFKRLWVSSMEEVAIKDGFDNLRNGKDYDNLYEAGLCRAKADWLVGMNASRLFTLRYDTKLTIGRVQTPTLAMLVDRDYKVKNFVKEKYYTVEIGTVDNPYFASSERIDDEIKAGTLLSECDGSPATVKSVKTEKKTANPPKLYDLTTLQREANRYYGYTAQQTLDYVQSLYEAKLCTYPRTDSQYITDDMRDTFISVTGIAKEFTEITSDSVNAEPVINNSKVSDHHALLITAEVGKKDISSLPTGERNVLFLIAARMILASSTPHIYEATSVKLSCADTEFSAKGKVILENGWKQQEQLLKSKIKNENTDDTETQDNEKALPPLSEGDVISPVVPRISEHFTSPPKPYTEDTLLSAMETAGNKDYSEDSDVEKKGLGTPATRAGIIENLIKGEYVERKKKQLIPTDKGINLIKVVPDEVKSPKMTADWESRLQSIEKGKESASAFMGEIGGYVGGLVSAYGSTVENSGFQTRKEAAVLGKCPNCGNEVKKGKFGFYCTGKCGMNLAKVYGKELTEAQLIKLLDGKEISFTRNDKKTTVLPECEPHSYTKDGKEYNSFQWKTKGK